MPVSAGLKLVIFHSAVTKQSEDCFTSFGPNAFEKFYSQVLVITLNETSDCVSAMDFPDGRKFLASFLT